MALLYLKPIRSCFILGFGLTLTRILFGVESITLESITSINALALGYATAMLEAAIVCFNDQGHSSNTILPVTISGEEDKVELVLEWYLDISDNIQKSYQEPNRTTDYGAMCVAVLLSINLIENCSAVEPTIGNNGFDFYLCDEDDELNFLIARLEVSGIRKETARNTVAKRVKVKKTQTSRSDHSGLPAYICVTEFGAPKATFVQK